MAGPLGAVWKPVDGKQARVFGSLGENMDAQLVTNQVCFSSLQAACPEKRLTALLNSCAPPSSTR
jgi:hypothetical protein